MGYDVLCTEDSPENFHEVVNQSHADIFLINIATEDIKFLDLNGLSLISNFKIPVIPVIHLTGDIDYSIIKRVASISSYGYLIKHGTKPLSQEDLKIAIEVALCKNTIKNRPKTLKMQEIQLNENEEEFYSFIQESLDGIVLLDENGRVITWNKGYERITGIKKEYALGREYWEIKQELTPPERSTPEHLERIKNLHFNALKNGRANFLGNKHETNILRPNGTICYIEQVAFPIKTKEGYRIGYVTRDITARKQMEKALEHSLHETEVMNQVVMKLVGVSTSKEIYSIVGQAVMELLPDSHVIISDEDAQNNIRIIECFGLEKSLGKIKNLLGINIFDIKFPVTENNKDNILNNRSVELKEIDNGIYDFISDKIPNKLFNILKNQLKIGKIYSISFSNDDENFGSLSIVLRDGKSLEHEKIIETIVSQASIALKRSNAESGIKESLEEKKVLLREIHHRVKNNMQIISSLLNLQSQHVEEVETVNVLTECQGRVRSMAMIHENLYQSPSLTRIDFKHYIKKLTSNIFHTYGVHNQKIELIFDIDEVELNIDTAMPCGLIINELVTNSLKYAFPESDRKSKGTIKIELKTMQDHFKLVVSDNGVGIPEDVNPEDTETLGLLLVSNLVNQIDGTVKFNGSHGTEFTITFGELNYKERI